ncbi:MAG: serine--tRNA ligase [Candidatus Omnitrophica bacterium]|jgi:seryl-tRNA synthetase|nr:serine--tRNA ligase [Candidatus Omnitrophota bacterium]
MLDAKFIRENPDTVRQALKDRNDKFDLDGFLSLDEERRRLMRQIEELSALQNKIDAEMKIIIKEKKEPAAKIAEGREIKKQISELNKNFNELEARFKDQLLRIPNVPHPSIPKGHPSNNKVIKEWGNKRRFDFKPLDHITLAEHLDIIDFKRAAKISGSNFVLFKGAGARLERALINFMLDLHTQKHGFKEVFPPMLVNRDSMRATGQLPKLEEDMYKLHDDELFLIPTAEVPVTNIHRDEVLREEDLPIYYTAYTACFRREAGSYGKDTKGLTRVHQFDKVELVKFVKPDTSYEELEKLLTNAYTVLELLNIPYRILELATGDISFAAAKCYDIEIYAPGIDKWLEVSSCSNFEDFQARRANIRYKEKETGKLKFVHTLNGSGVALARLVVAILENYQQADGTITIPEVLRTYMGGLEKISE